MTAEDLGDADDGWRRDVSDFSVRGLVALWFGPSAWKLGLTEGSILITVPSLEFVRVGAIDEDDALEAELSSAIEAALLRVAGAAGILREDRKTWTLEGDANVRDACNAVGAVLDIFAARIRPYVE
jgi:hypothetical protein